MEYMTNHKLSELARRGQRKTTTQPSSSSASAASREKGPVRYQFEPSASQEESTRSIQESGEFNFQKPLRKSKSNNTLASQRQPLHPVDPSLQHRWQNRQEQARSIRKSVSTTSLATVKRLVGRNHQQFPPQIPSEPSEKINQFSPSTLIAGPQDFSSAFTPTEIVIQPQRRHPRIALITKPESPLSMGGGLLHGEVSVIVFDTKNAVPVPPPLGIGYLSIDLVGVELCGRRHFVFQSLAVDLVDRNRSPPVLTLASMSVSGDGYWDLMPSMFSLPFQLQLPEDPGPPPFQDRHGSIRYILSATAMIRIGPEDTFVRDSSTVGILGPHNPRISLVTLPKPLNATDTFVLSRGLPFQDVTLRACLKRDVWVSGMSIFVDVHVRNRSMKHVNKITISLERVMVVYKHPIATLDEGFFRQSRLPDKIYRKTVARKTTTRSQTGWRGIQPHSRESQTWMLNLPTGLATIHTGRFFGVRYFLKVSLHLAYTMKSLEASLPVTILNPDSLDITSEFQPLPSTRTRARPSTINSELPPPSIRNPFGRTQDNKPHEHRTPTQARQHRETWQWVSEVSPHPSLMPSPLLPQFGVPVKMTKTPSKLRNEHRSSIPPVPHIPERLRPPLAEQSQEMLDRGHQNNSSDYPITSRETTQPGMNPSFDPSSRRPIGTSTLASLQQHVQSRPQGTFVPQPYIESSDSVADEGKQWVGGRGPVNPYTQASVSPDNLRSARVMFESPGAGPSIKQSPIQRRKQVANRRAISRSKDVQSIYRPRSGSEKKENRNSRDAGTSGPDNGWETVENFF